MEYSGIDALLGCLGVSWLCVSNINFASKVNLFDLRELPLPRKKPSSQNGRWYEAAVVCSNVGEWLFSGETLGSPRRDRRSF